MCRNRYCVRNLVFFRGGVGLMMTCRERVEPNRERFLSRGHVIVSCGTFAINATSCALLGVRHCLNLDLLSCSPSAAATPWTWVTRPCVQLDRAARETVGRVNGVHNGRRSLGKKENRRRSYFPGRPNHVRSDNGRPNPSRDNVPSIVLQSSSSISRARIVCARSWHPIGSRRFDNDRAGCTPLGLRPHGRPPVLVGTTRAPVGGGGGQPQESLRGPHHERPGGERRCR